MMNYWPRTRFLTLFIVVSIATFVWTSCAGPPSASNAGSDAAVLRRQADAWDQAIVAKDLDAIAANMSEDFRHIGRSGEISDKATFLQEIVSPDLLIDPYTVEDLDIRLYGDCALLIGQTRMTGTYLGEPFHSHYMYVDVYTRIDGRWRVCNVQISAIHD